MVLSASEILVGALVFYLSWAVILSGSDFHRVWSLSLLGLTFTFQKTLSASGGNRIFLAFVCIFLFVFCLALSPAQIFLFRKPLNKKRDLNSIEDSSDTSISDHDQSNDVFHVDIVAVHGLAANPDTTWQSGDSSKNEKSVNWLEDLLKQEESIKPRVLLPVNNTRWRQYATNKSLQHHGDDLLRYLRRERSTKKQQERPLILIGHSFGGLIVKQMFVVACRNTQDEFCQSIQQNTKGFIFLGTPHQGASVHLIGRIVALFGFWLGANTHYLDVVRPGSEQNDILHRSWRTYIDNACGIKSVVCVFEAVRETIFGFPITEVVDRRSAVVEGAHEIGFEQDHRGIQRYYSKSNENYRDILGFITKWVAISTLKDSATSNILTSQDEAILKSLGFEEMRLRRNDVDPPHPGTCRWIFNREEYLTWNQNSSGFFWVKGHPGTGKSTTMKQIYERYKNEQSGSSTLILDFFFSARGSDLQKSPIGMLRALLHQLYRQEPSCRQPVRHHFFEISSLGSHWIWQESELKKLLIQSLTEVPQTRQVTIFIDALDEAGKENARAVAEYLYHIVDQFDPNLHKVKISISCRHYPGIAVTTPTMVLVEEHNQTDISEFLKSKLDIKSLNGGERFDTKKWNAVVVELIQKSSRSFQWAIIVARQARILVEDGRSLRDIRDRLRQLPPDLGDLYTNILENLMASKDQVETLHLFQWVCFSTRPLTVTELRYAIAYDDQNDTDDSQNGYSEIPEVSGTDTDMCALVRTWSGGLVEISSSPSMVLVHDEIQKEEVEEPKVQVIHQSVADFMLEKGILILFRPMLADGEALLAIAQSHHRLFRTCLRYFDVADVQWHKYMTIPEKFLRKKPIELKTQLEEEAPFVSYATVSLFQHAAKCQEVPLSGDCIACELKRIRQIFPNWYGAYRVLDYYSPKSPKLGMTLLQVAAMQNLQNVVKFLIAEKVNVNEVDNEGNTALLFAARGGHCEIGKLLIDAGADVRARNRQFKIAINNAAGCGSKDFIQLLLDNGTAFNEISDDLVPALYTASEQGHIILVRYLVELGADVNAQGGFYGNALQAASRPGHENIVRYLVEKGADVNAQGGFYGNALQAASNQGNESVVRYLVEKGTKINAQGGEYGNALHAASCHGDGSIVRYLVEKGVEVNAQGGRYGNALQAASYHGDGSIVRYLVEKGVEVNAQGGRYGNALQAASRNGHEDIVRYLVEKGAEVNARGGEYGSALQAASHCGREDVVKYLIEVGAEVRVQEGGLFGNPLIAAAAAAAGKMIGLDRAIRLTTFFLERGIDVNAEAGKYGTALQAAADNWNSLPMVRFLVEKGAKVNSQIGIRGTALQLATKSSDLDTVKYLVENGADVNACVGQQDTALQSAIFGRYEEMTRFLLDHGADVNAPAGEFYNVLCASVIAGESATLQLLLDEGATMNAPGGKYGAPLCVAALYRRTDMVHYLLERGAEVDGPGGLYGPALSAATREGDIAIVKLLIQKGADVNAAGGVYGTALSAAAANGHFELVRLLLEHGANLHITAGRYGCALSAAATQGENSILQLLVERGADVNVRAGVYGTALCFAARFGMKNAVQYLLEKGIDVNVSGKKGTALQIARSCIKKQECHNCEEIIKILLANGATNANDDEELYSRRHAWDWFGINEGDGPEAEAEARKEAGAEYQLRSMQCDIALLFR